MLDGGGLSTPHPGCFTPGKDPVPIVQEAGWAPGLVWMGAENLAPTGIRSLDRPARSKSLYRLSYPSPSKNTVTSIFVTMMSWSFIVCVCIHNHLFSSHAVCCKMVSPLLSLASATLCCKHKWTNTSCCMCNRICCLLFQSTNSISRWPTVRSAWWTTEVKYW